MKDAFPNAISELRHTVEISWISKYIPSCLEGKLDRGDFIANIDDEEYRNLAGQYSKTENNGITRYKIAMNKVHKPAHNQNKSG